MAIGVLDFYDLMGFQGLGLFEQHLGSSVEFKDVGCRLNKDSSGHGLRHSIL